MPVNITEETLYSLTLNLSRILQNTYQGAVTSSTGTTNITDTNNDQVANYYADTVYQGTVWLPVYGTTHLVTTHTLNTLTISPAAGGTIAASSTYYAAPPFFPRLILIQSINQALRTIGKVPLQDVVTAVADQESYSDTDDVIFDEEILRVEVASDTDAPYDYVPHYHWHQDPDRTFYFEPSRAPTSAMNMKITYLAYSTELSADSDEISVLLPPPLVIWTAAVHALRWKIQQTKQDDPTYQSLLNEAITNAQTAQWGYALNRPRKVTFAMW